MTDQELLQMALDALEDFRGEYSWLPKQEKAWETLRARLAQPERAEQSWCMAMNNCENKCEDCPDKPNNEFNPDWDAVAVMVEEQQRMAKRIEELTQLVTSQGIRLMDAEMQLEKEWVGLTDADIDDVQYNVDCRLYRDYARAVEAQLKEKNT